MALVAMRHELVFSGSALFKLYEAFQHCLSQLALTRSKRQDQHEPHALIITSTGFASFIVEV